LRKTLLVQVPIFITTRTVLNTLIRMVYPFLPVFGRGLGVDLYLLSYGLTLRSAAGIFGPFLASIGDSRGRKVGMLFGISLFIIGAGSLVLWPSYPAFVVMLILSIMANLVFIPSMQAFLGDRVPYDRRGLVLALTEFGWSLSFILCVPAVGFLIARNGWQAPFIWLAALGVVSFLVLHWLLPGDRPKVSQTNNIWRNMGGVFAYRPALAGLLVGMCMSGGNELINLIFGVWLEDTFQVKIAALAAASAVIGISELGGEGLVTAFVDRLGKRRSVSIGLISNAAAALALLWLGSSLSGAMIGLFFIYLTFEITIVSAIPLMTEVFPAARATFMSMFIASIALGRSLGSLAAPRLYTIGHSWETMPTLLTILLCTITLDLAALLALRAIHDYGAKSS
jgi:MFS transporter, DHA1 family, inner membrane transport protein